MAEKSLKDLSNVIYKIAENSPKIQKDVKDIRDAVCGTDGLLSAILSIDQTILSMAKKNERGNIKDVAKNVSKSFEKSGANIIKSTDSITKVLEKILGEVQKIGGKSKGSSGLDRGLTGDNFKAPKMFEKSQNLGNMLQSIEVIKQLKGIKLKDFVTAKIKMKHMSSVMDKIRNLFKRFKNKKEADAAIGFASASADLMKKLAKIAILSKPAQLGARAIEKIFLGKKGVGGLLRVFKKINKHAKRITKARLLVIEIKSICGSMLLASLMLAGIGVISPLAMLGAVAMWGITWLLIKSFRLMSKSAKHIIKGSFAMIFMGAGLLAFALGFGVMRMATKDLTLKEVGVIGASIVGVGLAMLGIGLAAPYLIPGAAMLLLMGVSLGLFGLALRAWVDFDSEKPMKNIKTAIGGLREVFGIELGAGGGDKSFGQRLKGGLMDIAISVLDFGKTFFMMGSLLLAGAALGMLKVGISAWENYDGTKAAKNIKVSVEALKDAFGLTAGDGEVNTNPGRIGGELIDTACAILQMGKTFVQIGTLTLATALMDIIRVTLIPWENYDGTKAAGNIKTTVTGLKDAFGLNDRKGESVGGKIAGGLDDLFGLAGSILQMGKTFVQIGTLVLATGAMDIIRLALEPWNEYDSKPAIQHIKDTVSGLKDAFGLRKKEEKGGLLKGLFNAAKDLFATAGALAEAGPLFAELTNLITATASMNVIRESLQKFDNYNSKPAIANIKTTLNELGKLMKEGVNSISGSDTKSFKSIAQDFEWGVGSLERGAKKSNGISKNLKVLRVSLLQWTDRVFYNAGMMNASLNVIDSAFKSIEYKPMKQKSDTIIKLLQTAAKTKIKKSLTAEPVSETVKAINGLEIEKASIMVDLFKTFVKLKDVKPFERFNKAVDKFAAACKDVADSLDRIDRSLERTPDNETPGDEIPGVTPKPKPTNIDTVELANAIKEAIGKLNVRLDPSLLDINLIVDGTSGKSVKLTLQN